MELNIKNIHIFDERIPQKFRDFIELHRNEFNIDKSYKFKIIYKAQSVLAEEVFNFEHSIYENVTLKFKKDNKKSTALSMQLHKCLNILKDYGIECYNSAIEGDSLEDDNIIFILSEDNDKPSYSGRGKNKRRIKVSCIMPNKEYTTKTIAKFYNERMSKLYDDFSNCVNNRIMCEILEIEYTNDVNVIYRAFCEQYGDWWFCNDNRSDELKDKLINRAKIVLGIVE